jgi:hypothetical protein
MEEGQPRQKCICNLVECDVKCNNCEQEYHYDCAYRGLQWKCKNCSRKFNTLSNLLQSTESVRYFVYYILLYIVLLQLFLSIASIIVLDISTEHCLYLTLIINLPYIFLSLLIFITDLYLRDIEDLNTYGKRGCILDICKNVFTYLMSCAILLQYVHSEDYFIYFVISNLIGIFIFMILFPICIRLDNLRKHERQYEEGYQTMV